MNAPQFLPIRICSAHKSDVKAGLLSEIYTEHMLKAFFAAFERHGYAVLSRKLGICLSSERHENYGDWEEKNDDQIRAMLKEQAKNPAFKEMVLVYWNHRPLTHAKWIAMLAEAGFKVIERRTLAEIKALIEAKPSAATLDAWARQPQEVES